MYTSGTLKKKCTSMLVIAFRAWMLLEHPTLFWTMQKAIFSRVVKLSVTCMEMDETYNIWMKVHLFIHECTFIQNRLTVS